MILEILNWKIYNPRKDVQASSWFRMTHDFFENHEFFEFTADEKLFWIYLLCLASKKNQGTVQVVLQHASRVANIPENCAKSAIEKLKKFQMVRERTSRGRYVDDTQTSLYERTNERDETNETLLTHPESAPPSGTNDFIAAYCRKFKTRWGSNPDIKGKNAGIAKRLAKGWSRERAEILLDAFFSMPDAQLVKAKHPLTLLEYKLNEVTVYADSGTFTSQQQAHQADKGVANQMLLQKIREGKL